MREIELTLHNVKLLLREKVAQLKDQVNLLTLLKPGARNQVHVHG